MSALARMFAALRGREEARTVAPESPRYQGPTWWGTGGYIPADLNLSVDDQMAVSVAWACIRAIVDPIAASEIKVYEERDGKREEDRESWLYWLLNVEPHPDYTSQGWTEANLTRAVALGDSYDYIRRDGMSRPFSLQPLDPLRMTADDDGQGGIVYVYNDPINGRVLLPDRDVLHFRGPRSGGFYGDSPRARAAAALALAKAQENYATAYYANGAFPGVLLKPPANATGTLTEEQKKSSRAAWKSLFGGAKKAKGVGIMDPGWDLSVIPSDAEKSQIVEARRYQVAEVCRYFGVPGHLVGVPEASQGYGKNLAELGLGFVRQTLRPWARRIEEELRRKLMPDRRSRSWFIEYDLAHLTTGDAESVARASEMDVRNGILTINEARGMRGLPSVTGGDVTLLDGQPLARVLVEPKPAAPPKTGPGQSAPMDDGTEERVGQVAAALERHARRVTARSADLRSKGASEEEVAKHRDRLRLSARGAVQGAGVEVEVREIDSALASVEHGVQPEKVARHLIGAET